MNYNTSRPLLKTREEQTLTMREKSLAWMMLMSFSMPLQDLQWYMHWQLKCRGNRNNAGFQGQAPDGKCITWQNVEKMMCMRTVFAHLEWACLIGRLTPEALDNWICLQTHVCVRPATQNFDSIAQYCTLLAGCMRSFSPFRWRESTITLLIHALSSYSYGELSNPFLCDSLDCVDS